MFSGSRREVHAYGVSLGRSISERLLHRSASDSDSESDEPGSDGSGPEIASEDYQYAAFSAPDRIRLLSLKPGKSSDPIRCELFEARLASCSGQYEAVSYVWGPQKDLTRIQINEHGLGIGPNLFRALVDIRVEEGARLLWADAICIDQSNVEEKNMQVPMMKDIYTSALQTICYLGPRIPKKTRKLFRMLNDLAQEANMLPNRNQTAARDETETIPAFVNHVPITPIDSDLARKYDSDETILHMAACEWWHRAWTVQELLLSASPIMMIGRYATSWQTVRAAVNHGFNLQIWTPVHYGFFIDLIIVPYLSARALENQRRLMQQQSQQRHPDISARELLLILMQCRHRESQDPRDKIYAFLGILRDSRSDATALDDPKQLSVRVDYNLPVVYIYRLVSMMFIENLQNFDILGVCPASRIRGKPSWVTDWSVTKPLATPLSRDSLDRERTTHATKKTQAGCRFPADGETIVLSGYVISTIWHLSGTMPFASVNTDPIKLEQKIKEEAKEFFAQYPATDDPAPLTKSQTEPAKSSKRTEWLDRVGKVSNEVVTTTKKIYKATTFVTGPLIKMTRKKVTKMVSIFTQLVAWEKFVAAGPPSGPETSKQADDLDSYSYWQTLCAGTYKDGNQEQTKVLFQEWFASLQPVRDFLEDHPDYPQERPELVFGVYWTSSWRSWSQFWPYIACAQQRRLGWASDGRLCLLPAEAEVGDMIILACGGRAPLVVRADGDGYHEFVGEAYIHGVMDGEVFEEDKCRDIKIC
ncbi:unnamed protein product [Discula destructiva]